MNKKIDSYFTATGHSDPMAER